METTGYLNSIRSPQDIKCLDYRQLEQLAEEIRAFLIDSVSKTGGHLSSNLGMVELTIALHCCFSSPQDRFVFDVGHQCYTHKILTGRKDRFTSLRQADGLSGFPSPKESEHDASIAGHGSTSLSMAIGLARAKKLRNEPGNVIAIIGDGAFTGGMTYEGLNNIGDLNNLIVILNDNTMSISKNVGALARYFTKLRTSPGYYKAKSEVKLALTKTPVIGGGVTRGIQSFKSMIRRNIYQSTFFEEMGLQYIGPVDGHNIPELCSLFSMTGEVQQPLFFHAATVKGKGFVPAEQNPGAFHGVSSFNTRRITDPDISPRDSYSTVFGRELAKIGNDDKTVCAITAAMKYGTGLQFFKKTHPKRFFDVGMAEEFAVTYAAGLASGGMRPVVAIYSTFLQRGYDQIIHDVMLQNANVLFAIDRAGIVPGDGETHQGIYDAAYLSQQRNMPIVSPSNYSELEYWLRKLLLDYHIPRAIRYPRGNEGPVLEKLGCSGNKYDIMSLDQQADCAIITYSNLVSEAMEAQKLLSSEIPVDVIKLVWINPIPSALVHQLMQYHTIIFAEETISHGGIGEHVAKHLVELGYKGNFAHLTVPETGVDHASVSDIRKQVGLDAESIVTVLRRYNNEVGSVSV